VHLSEVLTNLPVEILPGNRVIEVRPHGVHKGRIASEVCADLPLDTRVVAIGDDRTDEDLFAALPQDAISLHVGPDPSRARFRLADVAAARRFLGWLIGEGERVA
jgi:trehalose 6-phosphate synthase/phosphatase